MNDAHDLHEGFLSKAKKALKTARLNFYHDDMDGAVNRAYYAMFNAARAAILASNAPVKRNFYRTHAGMIATFSEHIIKNDGMSNKIGSLLGKAQAIRLMADYKDESVSENEAKEILENAETFINAIYDKYFFGDECEDNKSLEMRPHP